MFSVLTRNRDFRRLFTAELVMFGGDWFVMVPLLGLLHRLTGGGLAGSLALAADTGMNALLLPYAGFVDMAGRTAHHNTMAFGLALLSYPGSGSR